MTYNGKRIYKRVDICIFICIADSLFCTAETNTTLEINYTTIKFFLKITCSIYYVLVTLELIIPLCTLKILGT